MTEEKINSLYITKMNDNNPIMIAEKSSDNIAIDIHTQFINVKTPEIKLDVNVTDQNGKQVGHFENVEKTPGKSTLDSQSYIGEITTFLVITPSEYQDINSLTFDVIINERAKGTTVLFLKGVDDER